MRKFGPKVTNKGGSGRLLCSGKYDSNEGILNLYFYNPVKSTTIEITDHDETYTFMDNTIFAAIVDNLILNNEQLMTLFANTDNDMNETQSHQIKSPKVPSPLLIGAQNYLNEARNRLKQQQKEEDDDYDNDNDNDALNSSIESAKSCISLIRKLQRMNRTTSTTNNNNNNSDNNNNVDDNDDDDGQSLLSEAYMCMYTAYQAMNKSAKAKSCLVLAHKNKNCITHTNTNELPSISSLTINDNISKSKSNSSGSDVDIENLQSIMQGYSSKKMDEEFQFSCTMCGECCRSADNILVTPLDLFRMTRSVSLRGMNITTTKQLLSHSRFKAALHFVMKDGLPIARLRPV